MGTVTGIGSIKAGKLVLDNKDLFAAELSIMKDCFVEVVVRPKNKRNDHGVIVKEIEIRMKELGNDVNEVVVHEFLKDKFNRVELLGENGEVIGYKSGSTAEMNKEEFVIYCDKIILWAAETLHIAIPLPSSK
jgi:hypothetical protein